MGCVSVGRVPVGRVPVGCVPVGRVPVGCVSVAFAMSKCVRSVGVGRSLCCVTELLPHAASSRVLLGKTLRKEEGGQVGLARYKRGAFFKST